MKLTLKTDSGSHSYQLDSLKELFEFFLSFGIEPVVVDDRRTIRWEGDSCECVFLDVSASSQYRIARYLTRPDPNQRFSQRFYRRFASWYIGQGTEYGIFDRVRLGLHWGMGKEDETAWAICNFAEVASSVDNIQSMCAASSLMKHFWPEELARYQIFGRVITSTFLIWATEVDSSGATGSEFTRYIEAPSQELAEESFRRYHKAIIDGIEEQFMDVPIDFNVINWLNLTEQPLPGMAAP